MAKKNSGPSLDKHLANIQGIIGSAFSSFRHGTYWLLQVEHSGKALAWLHALHSSGLVRSLADIGQGAKPSSEAAMVAFSFTGLGALGLTPRDELPFPTPFTRGMTDAARQALLHDRPASQWQWVDAAAPGDRRIVHVLLGHFRENPASLPPMHPCDPAQFRGSPTPSGLVCVQQVDTCPSYLQPRPGIPGAMTSFEPFGFVDGLAQPLIRGLRLSRAEQQARAAAGPVFDDRVVAPGEFLLGYKNEFGELAYCPDVKQNPTPAVPFSLDGSYLAVRQIRQDVAAFRAFERAQAPRPPGEPALVEKMIGRRKDGAPLVQCPLPPSEPDAFRYRVEDAVGLQCPRGAHIRRANPRDMQGVDVDSGLGQAKSHRILRRGRIYAAPQPASRYCHSMNEPCGSDAARGQSPCGHGLFFIAVNAHIERQFETLQRWLTQPDFNDLSDEVDVLTESTAGPRAFTEQALPVGVRHAAIPKFTELIGGGYFFLPSLAAIEFIASGHRPGSTTNAPPAGQTASPPAAPAPPRRLARKRPGTATRTRAGSVRQ